MADQFDLGKFLDGIIGPLNPLDPRNPVHAAVTNLHHANPLVQAWDQGPGAALAGGPAAGDVQPLTAADIDTLLAEAAQAGLSQEEIQQLAEMTAGAQGTGRTALTIPAARDFIATRAGQRQIQGNIDQADTDLGTFLNELEAARSTELGGYDLDISRLTRASDPNMIRTDAEYGKILKDVETRLATAQRSARDTASSISAGRGVGFSGAGLSRVNAADSNMVLGYGNAVATGASDALGRRDSTRALRNQRAADFTSTADSARRSNTGFKQSALGSKLGYSSDEYSQRYGDSLAPRAYAQNEAERGLYESIVGPGQHFLDTAAGAINNAASAIPMKWGK